MSASGWTRGRRNARRAPDEHRGMDHLCRRLAGARHHAVARRRDSLVRCGARTGGADGLVSRPSFPAAAAAGAAMITLSLAAGHVAAAAIGAVVCTSATKVLVSSRRRVATAEGVARFASVLANQAAVAVTASDAVARAAPLVERDPWARRRWPWPPTARASEWTLRPSGSRPGCRPRWPLPWPTWSRLGRGRRALGGDRDLCSKPRPPRPRRRPGCSMAASAASDAHSGPRGAARGRARCRGRTSRRRCRDVAGRHPGSRAAAGRSGRDGGI